MTRKGWDALTTNAIAQRAGVNIASLYQYFPNKKAVVAELRRQHLLALKRCEQGPAPKSLGEALERGVDTMIRQRLTNPELHRVFNEELPRGTGLPPLPEASTHVSFDPALLPDVPNLEMAAFIAHSVVAAAIDDAAREHPAWLHDETFRSELVLLLHRYLVRGRRNT